MMDKHCCYCYFHSLRLEEDSLLATHLLICSLHSCQIQTFWPPLLEPSQMLLQGTSAWRHLFLLDSQRQSTGWFQRSVCKRNEQSKSY